MEAKYSYYDFNNSIDRIDYVLKGSDASYENKGSIPSRDSLTFNNGYYVSCPKIPLFAEKHTDGSSNRFLFICNG